MERNQFKRREFNELDWYNPLTWFGQPSVAPPAFTGTSQDEKSAGLPGWKTNSESTLSTALKSNFVSPFKKVETTVVNDVKKVEKSIENIATDIEQDIKWLGKEALIGGEWVVSTSETIGKEVVDVSRGLYKFGSKSVVFVEKNYMLILFGLGSYLGARYVNEVKQAIA